MNPRYLLLAFWVNSMGMEAENIGKNGEPKPVAKFSMCVTAFNQISRHNGLMHVKRSCVSSSYIRCPSTSPDTNRMYINFFFLPVVTIADCCNKLKIRIHVCINKRKFFSVIIYFHLNGVSARSNFKQ